MFAPSCRLPRKCLEILMKELWVPSCLTKQKELVFLTLSHTVLYWDVCGTVISNSFELTKPAKSVTWCYHQPLVNGRHEGQWLRLGVLNSQKWRAHMFSLPPLHSHPAQQWLWKTAFISFLHYILSHPQSVTHAERMSGIWQDCSLWF